MELVYDNNFAGYRDGAKAKSREFGEYEEKAAEQLEACRKEWQGCCRWS